MERTPTRDMRQSSGSGPTDFAHFDRRTQEQSYRGMSAAAFVYAATYTVAYATGWWLDPSSDGAPPLSSVAVAGFCVLAAALVGWASWQKRFHAHAFCAVSQGFAVLGSLGILASVTEWRAMIEGGVHVIGISWVAVWLLIYPNVVAISPLQTLKVGVASLLMFPLVVWLSFQRDGLPVVAGLTSLQATVDFMLPIFVSTAICVGIAVYMSARIWGMTRDISRARLMGNYELEEKLGQGGMGEVWRARHRLLARPAAVKLIRASALGEDAPSAASVTLRRFEREAKATAALTSPHTVSLYDFGIDEEGTFYYVMELLEGLDLRQLVERDGPLPAERVVHLLRQACASLADAHAAGLIHRDIKPANLFVCRRGLRFDFLKVLDFGLVKGTGAADREGSQLTVEGIASGTPAFMAPEMAAEAPLDGRADLYALGCVAYWLLTGQLVFTGDTGLAVLMKHAQEPPVPPSRLCEEPLDPQLERIVLDCLAKRSEDRPASAVELDRQLAEVEGRLGIWSPERAERWWRSRLPHLASAGSPPVAGAVTA